MLSPYRFNASAPEGATSGKPLLVNADPATGFPIKIGESDILDGAVGQFLIVGADNKLAQTQISPSESGIVLNVTEILGNPNPPPESEFVQSGILYGSSNTVRQNVNMLFIADSIQLRNDAEPHRALYRPRGVTGFLNATNSAGPLLFTTANVSSGSAGSQQINILTGRVATGTGGLLNMRSGDTLSSGTTGNVHLGCGHTSDPMIALTPEPDITLRGDVLFFTDNAFDIGETGLKRPRNIFVGSVLQIEANNGFKLTAQTNHAGVNAGTLGNAPAAADPAFWFPVTVNGTNYAVPAWAI